MFGPNGQTIGTASYWIPIIKDSGFDTPEGRQLARPGSRSDSRSRPSRMPMAAQLSDLVVFDFLTANPDRYSGGNMKMSPDGTQLFYMDNTMSFFVDAQRQPAQPRGAAQKTQRFSRDALRSPPPHHRRDAREGAVRGDRRRLRDPDARRDRRGGGPARRRAPAHRQPDRLIRRARRAGLPLAREGQAPPAGPPTTRAAPGSFTRARSPAGKARLRSLSAS